MLSEVLNTKDIIGRGSWNFWREDHVGTLWEGVRTENNIYRKGENFDQQAKERVKKIKIQALQETDHIMGYFEAANKRVQRLERERENSDEIRREVKITQSKMFDSSSLYNWEYQIDAATTHIMAALEKYMKRLNILVGPSQREVSIGILWSSEK